MGTKSSVKVFSFVGRSDSSRVKSDRGHHHRGVAPERAARAASDRAAKDRNIRFTDAQVERIWAIVSAHQAGLCAPESAHQQWGESPHRTEHWLSVAEGNCVAEGRGGEQPEANDQSIIKKMMNSIRPDALASLRRKGEAQDGSRPERESGNFAT